MMLCHCGYMARLTITLPKERHRALKEEARPCNPLVQRARQRSALTPAEAEKLAVRETRAHRIEDRH